MTDVSQQRHGDLAQFMKALNALACAAADRLPTGHAIQTITLQPSLFAALSHEAWVLERRPPPPTYMGLVPRRAENGPLQLEIWTQAGRIVVLEGEKADAQEVASAINAIAEGEARTVSGVVVERPLQPGTAAAFVAKALEMEGKPYIFGAEVGLKDSSPRAFDCSELVQWACAQVGVSIPDGSGAQFGACIGADLQISPTAAKHIRGALLFRISRDSMVPSHVAISLGDGRTIEARGKDYGVGQFSSEGRGWTAGALVPGMRY